MSKDSGTRPAPTLKLSAAARVRVVDEIEAQEMAGDRQVASDLQVLLDLHDQVHGIGGSHG